MQYLYTAAPDEYSQTHGRGKYRNDNLGGQLKIMPKPLVWL